jgi:hypothetical protein
MAKMYPTLDVRLEGEPGDVKALVTTIGTSAGQIEEATSSTQDIILDGLEGPTRQRAWGKAQSLLERSHGINGALKDAAEKLGEWAGDIDKARNEFDDLERRLKEKELERADVSLKLYFLAQKLKADPNPTLELQYLELDDRLYVLDQDIAGIKERAQSELTKYEDKAEEVGRTLVSGAFESPAVSNSQRAVRDALGFSQGLGKLLDVAGLLPFLGGIGGKALSKGGREVLDRINDSVEKALLAGAGAKIAANARALAGGASVSPFEVFLDGVNLPGIGPLSRLKNEALERIIEDDIARAVIGKALGQLEGKVKGEVFEKPELPDPIRP